LIFLDTQEHAFERQYLAPELPRVLAAQRRRPRDLMHKAAFRKLRDVVAYVPARSGPS
jgi:hypothetical protein